MEKNEIEQQITRLALELNLQLKRSTEIPEYRGFSTGFFAGNSRKEESVVFDYVLSTTLKKKSYVAGLRLSSNHEIFGIARVRDNEMSPTYKEALDRWIQRESSEGSRTAKERTEPPWLEPFLVPNISASELIIEFRIGAEQADIHEFDYTAKKSLAGSSPSKYITRVDVELDWSTPEALVQTTYKAFHKMATEQKQKEAKL